MSHQTGIQSGDELKDVFRRCKTDGDIRMVKVTIEDEMFIPTVVVDIGFDSGEDWRRYYDTDVKPNLEKSQPCYILYRTGCKDQWLFVAFTPDTAKVRLKMVYAASRATLKQEFGGGFIKQELTGTSIEDILLKGYDEHVSSALGPPPLTDREEEMKQMKADENNSEIGISTRHQTVQGLAFPLTNDLVEAIDAFGNKQVNYLRMSIDIQDENIFLQESANYDVSELQTIIKNDQAYYHAYRYEHRFNGESLASNVFLYTMPVKNSSIKSRMLFSSCKGPLIDALEMDFKIDFTKKLEVHDETITEDFLLSEIHPPVVEEKSKFSKPKAPGRRGAPRKPTRPVQ